MPGSKKLRRIVLHTAHLILTAFSMSAIAQIRFDLPAQALCESLIAVGHIGKVNVLYDPRQIEGVQAPPLKGESSTDEALARLLEGTHFKAVHVSLAEKTIRIVSAEPNFPPSSDSNAGSKQAEPTPTGALASKYPDRQNHLEEVLVTAQKREERLENVPISMSVLTTSQLESSGISSASDALATIPGVAINQDYGAGGTLVTIRGVASGQSVYAGSSPVAYYLDSVPFGFVRSSLGPDEEAYDLERIEVLRGPQGTLYGASALNGVVRVLTRDPDLNRFDIKARASDSVTENGANNYQGDMAINVPLITGKLAARAVVGYANDSGWIDTPIKTRVNDDELRNYRIKVGALPIDSLSIGLSLWSSRQDYGAPSVAGNDLRNSSVLNRPLSIAFDAYAAKIGYEAAGYSILSATSYLNYRNDEELDLSSLLGFPFQFFTGLHSHVFSQEVLLSSPTDGIWRWNVGGMYRSATESRLDYGLVPASGFVDSLSDTSRSYAVFGEMTRTFLDRRLEMTLGIRQFNDHVTQEGLLDPTAPPTPDEGRFHATTPRAVATWHASDNAMFYGSYSQGFRSGFPQDIAAPNYRPVNADKLYNYEIGAKGNEWDGRVSFDLAVYYMDWHDVQQSILVPFENSYAGVVVNGQSASGEGIDIGLSFKPIQGLSLGITGSWNNLEMDAPVNSGGVILFDKGDRLNFSPETTASASAEYAFPVGQRDWKGRITVAANYTSAQIYRSNLSGPVVVGVGDPMVLGRVALTVDAPDRWTATVFINNVNNERGSPLRPFNTPDLSSRVRPRTTGLQLEYHLK